MLDNLTRDNYPLSRPTTADAETSHIGARGCTDAYPDAVAAYVRAGLSENTRRAYRADLEHFAAWGGTIPATDGLVASYLADHVRALSVATLARRLATISRAHEAKRLPNPVRSALVRATIRGIKRSVGVAQKQAKPLLKEDLFEVLAAMGDNLKDARDRALLLIGFAGGFRRSEIVRIDRNDVETVRQGIVIHLRRSKTDQMGTGRRIGIPLGRARWCPVSTLEAWIARAGISKGPVFRPVDRYGHVLPAGLSGEAVSLVLQERMAAAGFDPAGYSGHSLRAGFVTSAVRAGVSSWKIMQQTGHRSDAMLGRYVRDGELFANNAAGSLL